MKTYKKEDYKSNYCAKRAIDDLYLVHKEGDPEDKDIRLTEEELLRLGFEEVKEEVEVPEWFNFFLNKAFGKTSFPETTEQKMYAQESYNIFLKHYPKQEELPIEDILKQIKNAYFTHIDNGELPDGCLFDNFENILRQYTIKQDTLQPLDPLSIQMIMTDIYENTDIDPVEVPPGVIGELLSKYGTPTCNCGKKN